jgi:hypothetical protein
MQFTHESGKKAIINGIAEVDNNDVPIVLRVIPLKNADILEKGKFKIYRII